MDETLKEEILKLLLETYPKAHAERLMVNLEELFYERLDDGDINNFLELITQDTQ